MALMPECLKKFAEMWSINMIYFLLSFFLNSGQSNERRANPHDLTISRHIILSKGHANRSYIGAEKHNSRL